MQFGEEKDESRKASKNDKNRLKNPQLWYCKEKRKIWKVKNHQRYIVDQHEIHKSIL